MFGLNIKIKHNTDHPFIRLYKTFNKMKNLISSFSILYLKKNLSKNSKANSSIDNEKLVHYRRDLDSLG